MNSSCLHDRDSPFASHGAISFSSHRTNKAAWIILSGFQQGIGDFYMLNGMVLWTIWNRWRENWTVVIRAGSSNADGLTGHLYNLNCFFSSHRASMHLNFVIVYPSQACSCTKSNSLKIYLFYELIIPSELPLHSVITKKYCSGSGGWICLSKKYKGEKKEKDIPVKENIFCQN